MAIYSPTNIQTEQQNDFVGVQNLSTTFKHNFEAQKQLFAQEIRVHYNLREPKGNKPTMVFLVVYINKKQIRISTGCKPSHCDYTLYHPLLPSYLFHSHGDNTCCTILNAITKTRKR